MSFLRLLLGLCPHRSAWPQYRRQRCPDCGMSRRYVIGEKPGPWERDMEWGMRFRKVRQMWLKLKEGK